MKSIKCILGFHRWKKRGGASNVGGGKFKVILICDKCGKIKEIVK